VRLARCLGISIDRCASTVFHFEVVECD